MKVLKEKLDWTDVYKVFESIVNVYWPEEEQIAKEVEKIYNIHKGEYIWDKAWEKWTEYLDTEEEEWDPDDVDESLNKRRLKESSNNYILITDIDWDTDDEDVDLPSEVKIPVRLFKNEEHVSEVEFELEVSDYLSDNYGWLVNTFEYDPEDLQILNESFNKKELKEDLDNLEITDNTVVVPQPTGAAEEESKEFQKRFEDATKVPEDAPLFGAKNQPVPDEPVEPKATLDESLFNEGVEGFASPFDSVTYTLEANDVDYDSIEDDLINFKDVMSMRDAQKFLEAEGFTVDEYAPLTLSVKELIEESIKEDLSEDMSLDELLEIIKGVYENGFTTEEVIDDIFSEIDDWDTKYKLAYDLANDLSDSLNMGEALEYGKSSLDDYVEIIKKYFKDYKTTDVIDAIFKMFPDNKAAYDLAVSVGEKVEDYVTESLKEEVTVDDIKKLFNGYMSEKDIDMIFKESLNESHFPGGEYETDVKYDDPIKQELAHFINDTIYHALDNLWVAALSEIKGLPEPSEFESARVDKLISRLVRELVAEYYGSNVTESLNESYVEEWWGQVEEDPFDVASRYNLKCTKLDQNGDEVLYRFEGSKEDIDHAIGDGYFYSVIEKADESHSDDLDESITESEKCDSCEDCEEDVLESLKKDDNWSKIYNQLNEKYAVHPVHEFDLRVFANKDDEFAKAKSIAESFNVKYKVERASKSTADGKLQMTLIIPEEMVG